MHSVENKRSSAGLSVRGLSFGYGAARTALRGLTFDVPPGECLLLLGPNGAGKSTLLHVLAGLVPEYIRGYVVGDVSAYRSVEQVGRGDFGLVQQNPDSQLVALRVDEEVAFGLCNAGVSRDIVLRETDQVLRWFGLGNLAARVPDELSFGQKQRLVTAAVTILRPQFLLLDEPTSNSDAMGRASIVDMIRTLKSSGTTQIIATHDLDAFSGVADRALLLSANGELVFHGDVTALSHNPRLLQSHGVQAAPSSEQHVLSKLADGGTETQRRVDRPVWPRDEHRPALLGGSGDGDAAGPLTVENVGFSYAKGRPVLSGVTFSVNDGECFGIVGNNGAGKSTLLRVVAGLLRPSTGVIRLGGRRIDGMGAGAIATSIACVLQDPDVQLLYADTVQHELRACAPNGRVYSEGEIARSLQLVGIDDLGERFPGALSFGEKKKVLIAAALLRHPRVLMLDEPFFTLDGRGLLHLKELIARVSGEGIITILVSHDLRNLGTTADRIGLLVEGAMVRTGAATDLSLDPSVGDVLARPQRPNSDDAE